MPLEVERHVHLVAQHLAGGDPGPAGDHLADEVRIHHHGHERSLALQRLQLGRQLDEVRPLGVAVAAGALLGRRLEALPCRAHLGDEVPLAFPALLEVGDAALSLLLALGQLGEALGVVCARRFLPLEHTNLHRDVVELSGRVLERGGDRVLAEGEPRAGGVEDTHRLVGELAVREIAVGEAHRRFRSFVQDAHLVVLLECRHDATHHHQAGLLGRLFDLDELEAARQRRIFLEILLVLRPRGGRDGAQLAARERGLQEIRRITLPGRSTGADHGMRLVDEQDDRGGR